MHALLLAGSATAAWALGLLAGSWVFRRAEKRLLDLRRRSVSPIRLQSFELLSGERIDALLRSAVRLLRLVAAFALTYAWLSTVLRAFDRTRPIARQLVDEVVSALAGAGDSVLAYLPRLAVLCLVIVVARGLLRLVRVVFEGIGRGTIEVEGFHSEWAAPTFRLVRLVLIAFAVAFAFPFLPGAQSRAFQGVSIFLGILVSLGAPSSIGNLVAGLVFTYMRPFQVGDRVRLGDSVGDVLEKTLLVTRLRTIKNVEIIVPNAQVLAGRIENFSALARGQGLIVHTEVTIGYDAPWRQVHELLLAAARGTRGVLGEPAPFVLQRGLDDFFVRYEINGFTAEPNRMVEIVSDLHQNIQDRFNESGVEIMSPHFTALRDGNSSTTPAPRAEGERAFAVRSIDAHKFVARPADAATRGNP